MVSTLARARYRQIQPLMVADRSRASSRVRLASFASPHDRARDNTPLVITASRGGRKPDRGQRTDRRTKPRDQGTTALGKCLIQHGAVPGHSPARCALFGQHEHSPDERWLPTKPIAHDRGTESNLFIKFTEGRLDR